MKNLLLAFMMLFVFTACEKEVLVEAPQTECAKINAYYEDLTEGLSVQEASTYIQDWQDALNAAGCPSVDSL